MTLDTHTILQLIAQKMQSNSHKVSLVHSELNS